MPALDRAALLDELAAFIDIPSVTGEEGAYAAAAARALADAGFLVELAPVTPQRANVVARRGQGRVLFCTHLDTVPPFFPARRFAGGIAGRGACDAKGAFVCMLAAARALIARGAEDLAFLLVVGEEVDHAGARAAATLGLKAEAVVLGEPTEGKLMAAQKGILKLRLVARGRAAHSGYPETGSSAIAHLLDALERVRALPLDMDALLGPAFLNIGRIAGGVAVNVLAPAAEAELLFRTVAPADDILTRVAEVLGSEVSMEIGTRTDPIRLWTLPNLETAIAGFGTDAPHLTGIGPVLLAGPGSIRIAHTAEERIQEEDLAAGVELYVQLADRILGGERPVPPGAPGGD